MWTYGASSKEFREWTHYQKWTTLFVYTGFDNSSIPQRSNSNDQFFWCKKVIISRVAQCTHWIYLKTNQANENQQSICQFKTHHSSVNEVSFNLMLSDNNMQNKISCNQSWQQTWQLELCKNDQRFNVNSFE